YQNSLHANLNTSEKVEEEPNPYDWSSNLDRYNTRRLHHCPTHMAPAPEHVPMIKTIWPTGTQPTLTPGAKFVLGYNEPNHVDQANLTPKQAADFWPEVERVAAGLPLISPVTAGQNFPWLDEFFRLCHNCRVDYIGAHLYSCSADQVMHFLQQLHNRYHKKVWLTEFACPHSWDENAQLHLMQTLYAWFEARIKHQFGDGFVTPAASLLHNNSATLTKIGRFYNDFEPSSSTHIVG
ncbi:ASL1-like protein, partial [Mya arenaria]